MSHWLDILQQASDASVTLGAIIQALLAAFAGHVVSQKISGSK